MAHKTFGTTVTIDGTTIGELTDVQFSGGDVNNIETTAHDASNNAKTFIGGLIDSGTCELSGNLQVDDEGQIALESDVGNVDSFVVTYPGVMTRTFSAVVGKINYGGGIDDKITFTCSLKITGAITNAAL